MKEEKIAETNNQQMSKKEKKKKKRITDSIHSSLHPMQRYLSCSLGSRCLAIGRADPRLPGEIWDNILGRLLDGPGPSPFFFRRYALCLFLFAPIKVWVCEY